MSIDPGFKRLGFAMWVDGKLTDSGVTGIERESDKEPWTDYISRGVLFFSDFFKCIDIGFPTLSYLCFCFSFFNLFY